MHMHMLSCSVFFLGGLTAGFDCVVLSLIRDLCARIVSALTVERHTAVPPRHMLWGDDALLL
jgi:hypothetical protein